MQRRAVVRWYKNLYYEYTMYFPVTAETVEGKRQDFIKAIEEYKVLGAPRHPETGELFKPDHEMYIAGCDPYEPNPNVALTSLDDIAKHYKK